MGGTSEFLTKLHNSPVGRPILNGYNSTKKKLMERATFFIRVKKKGKLNPGVQEQFVFAI